MKIDPGKISAWLGIVASLGAGLSWAWQMHNNFLMDQLAPMKRWAYVGRINNYRRQQCMGDYSNQAELDLVLSQYEELVGRPIADRSCDTL